MENNNVEILGYSVVAAEINKKLLLDYAVDTIVKCSGQVVSGFCDIGLQLKVIRDQELYKIAGYDDVYAFSEAMFGYRATSTKNFIGLVEKFCSIRGNSDVELKEEFEDYSLTQLVELLPVDDSELANYKPSMKVKDIRIDKKVSRLTKDVDALKKLVISEIKALKCLGEKYELKVCYIKKADEILDEYRLFTIYVELECKLSLIFPLAWEIDCRRAYCARGIDFDASRVDVPGFKVPGYVYGGLSYTESLSELIERFNEKIPEVAEEVLSMLKEHDDKKAAALGVKSDGSSALVLPCTLKNDKIREEHVKDDANWEFVEHINFLGIDIYKFKTIIGFFRFDKKNIEEEGDGEKETVFTDYYEMSSGYYSNYGLGYSCSNVGAIVRKLKELRI